MQLSELTLPVWAKERLSPIHLPTLYCCLCIMLGTGILQLPYTLKQGGWLAIFTIVLVAFMATYTGKVLVLCLYARPKSDLDVSLIAEKGENTEECLNLENRMSSYAELGYESFGRVGEVISQVIHKANQVGVSALFLILAAGFMEEIFGKLSQRMYVLISGLAVSPVVLFSPAYKEMWLLSFCGVAASFCVVVVVTVVGLQQHFSHEQRAHEHEVLNTKTMASAFAAILLSFGGHANFPTVEADMPDPTKFAATITATFATLTCIYIPVASVGYFVYGIDVESPILDSLPSDGFLPILTKLWITFHVLTSYPILMLDTAIELQVLLNFPKREDNPKLEAILRYTLRASLVVTTVSFAYFIPYFGDVMSLVGATCVAGTVFLMPCAFNLKLRAHHMSALEKAGNYLILLIGLVGGSIGAYQAFNSLVDKVNDDGE